MTLAILAGGAGRRMGMPKAWLRIGDTPILAWLLDRVLWPGPTMLVTAPAVPCPPAAELFDRHVIDPVGGQGPLRGILTALSHTNSLITAVLTVDMPVVERRHLAWLVGMLAASPSIQGAMCRVNGGVERIEPFPSVFRAAAANMLSRRMAMGLWSVQDLCSEPLFVAMPQPADWTAELWTNLNRPEELAAFNEAITDKATRKAK